MLFIRSLLFSAGMILSLMTVISSASLLFAFPVKVRSAYIRNFSLINMWLLKKLCGIGPHIEGLENIPMGPAIIMCKHQSAWETMALQLIFPIQTFVAKKELKWVPFFGWGLSMMKPIYINRGAGQRAVRQLIEQGKARLDEGLWVVIFPEGTRTGVGEKRRYKVGGAMLAVESGYPVVPVAHNAGVYWGRRAFLKRPGTIEVRIGKPIETKGRKPDEILQEVQTWIESTVDTLPTRRR